jgi:hypothetical protein
MSPVEKLLQASGWAMMTTVPQAIAVPKPLSYGPNTWALPSVKFKMMLFGNNKAIANSVVQIADVVAVNYVEIKHVEIKYVKLCKVVMV